MLLIGKLGSALVRILGIFKLPTEADQSRCFVKY